MIEHLHNKLLFRWFVGLGMDNAVWSHAVSRKSRDALLTAEGAQHSFAKVKWLVKCFRSNEDLTVDGKQIHSWISQQASARRIAPTRTAGKFVMAREVERHSSSDTHREARL